MNNYELMVIFTPVLSEEDYKAAQKKYAAFVKENGGEVFILGSGVQCAIRLQ